MANEFTKPTKVIPAIVGQLADPDVYNQNIAAQSKGTIIPIDEDGNYADGDIGDQTVGSIGALINNLKLRQGGAIKIYDSSGVFVKDVSLDQATESAIGQAEIATQAEVWAGTDDQRFVTAAKILERCVQTVDDPTASVVTGSTVIPNDNTRPQSGEGVQFLTTTITPKKATNILEIHVMFAWSSNANATNCMALFKDSDTSALAAHQCFPDPSFSVVNTDYFIYRMTAGTTSAIVFKMRAGQDTGHTITMNGVGGAGKMGGGTFSRILIKEYQQ